MITTVGQGKGRDGRKEWRGKRDRVMHTQRRWLEERNKREGKKRG